jgi:hypothetical protein
LFTGVKLDNSIFSGLLCRLPVIAVYKIETGTRSPGRPLMLSIPAMQPWVQLGSTLSAATDDPRLKGEGK